MFGQALQRAIHLARFFLGALAPSDGLIYNCVCVPRCGHPLYDEPEVSPLVFQWSRGFRKRGRNIQLVLKSVSLPSDFPKQAEEAPEQNAFMATCSPHLFGETVVPTDTTHRVDMTCFQQLRLEVHNGLATAKLGGETAMFRIIRDEMRLQETWFGRILENNGDVWRRDFTNCVRNQNEPDHLWSWQS